MSLDPTSEKAARTALALNRLGHVAMGQSLEAARHAMGDAKLRDALHEDATALFDMVDREEKLQSTVVPRPGECKTALSRFRALVRSVDFDDVSSMDILREHARNALEAFLGQTLPETEE